MSRVTSRKKKRKKTRAISPIWGWILLAAGLAAHIYLVSDFNFTQDDAFISFRYAENYINDHGLVYNISERVEGYTNFLWTILMILGRVLGIDFIIFSKILGSIFGLGVILFLFFLGRFAFGRYSSGTRALLAGACCLLLGTVYSFAYWTVAGLETAAFACMVMGSLYFYFRRSMLTIPALVIATLLRPEGGMVCVFIILFEVIANKKLTRYAKMIAALYILFLLPHLFFKISYYGAVLPNPFYAKTSFTFQQVINGLEYTGQFFWHYLAAGLFIVPALISFRKLPRAVRMVMIFLLVYTLYITLIGGDVLKVHRFFLPLFPLYALIAVFGIYTILKNKLIVTLALAALLAWQLIVPRDHVATFHRLEKGLAEKMTVLLDRLLETDKSNFSLAVSTIGIVGYRLMDHTVIDLLGLTDSTIARHPEPAVDGLETTWRESHFNSQYLLSRQPDYILFSTGSKPSAPAERALFMYSSFLNNYRAIGYFAGTKLHPIYKRFNAIASEIVRDVDVKFVQNYNRGINLYGAGKDNVAALAAFDVALKYSPEPVYPYLYYYMATAQRHAGNVKESYLLLKKAAEIDTLSYEVYKDLYFYEYRMKDYDAARYYRSVTARLVPWYMSRLDSLVRGDQ
jgi:hypothetical protein